MDHLEDFLIYLGSEKGLSLNTLSAYRRDIEAFLTFQKEKELFSFAEGDILQFLALLRERSYATSSISRTIVSLRLFFRFLKAEGILNHDPATLTETPRIWQLIPEVLSIEEVESMIASIPQEGFWNLRDIAIIETLYASGIRVSELCTLNIFHVDDKQIRVKGKGGKERMVPIAARSIQSIDNYLLYRSEEDEREAPLFISKRGHRISRAEVWQIVSRQAKKSGDFQKRLPAHIAPLLCYASA